MEKSEDLSSVMRQIHFCASYAYTTTESTTIFRTNMFSPKSMKAVRGANLMIQPTHFTRVAARVETVKSQLMFNQSLAFCAPSKSNRTWLT
jgi:hypothetical protein